MRHDSKKLLYDMKEAADNVASFLDKAAAAADLSGDKMMRAAIYFQFMIIGEALSQLRAKDGATAERISEYERVIGFRNQVTHGYGQLDDDITWRIIQDKLPILRRELEGLLAEGREDRLG